MKKVNHAEFVRVIKSLVKDLQSFGTELTTFEQQALKKMLMLLGRDPGVSK